MSINFNWLSQKEEFNSEKIYSETEEVFSIEILEREGCRPRAVIRLLNHANLSQRLLRKYLGVISKNGKVLFKGILSGSVPSQLDENIMTITLETHNLTEKEELEKLSHFLQQENSYDPLFYGNFTSTSFNDLLESSNHLLYWDRVTGKMSLSDLFKGSDSVSLEKNDPIFAQPFSMSYSHAPLEAIEIELIAKWMHTRQGLVDITPFLESKFKGGRINTLTGLSLAHSWWQEGSAVSSTKYWIASSDIQEITPTFSKGRGKYPRFCKIKTSDNAPTQIVKHYWYKANLILGWSYLQPRQEIATVRLNNAHQLTSSTKGKTRKIRINLCNLGGDV